MRRHPPKMSRKKLKERIVVLEKQVLGANAALDVFSITNAALFEAQRLAYTSEIISMKLDARGKNETNTGKDQKNLG